MQLLDKKAIRAVLPSIAVMVLLIGIVLPILSLFFPGSLSGGIWIPVPLTHSSYYETTFSFYIFLSSLVLIFLASYSGWLVVRKLGYNLLSAAEAGALVAAVPVAAYLIWMLLYWAVLLFFLYSNLTKLNLAPIPIFLIVSTLVGGLLGLIGGAIARYSKK